MKEAKISTAFALVAAVLILIVGVLYFIKYLDYNTEKLIKKHTEYAANFKGINKQTVKIGENIILPDGTKLIFAGIDSSSLKILSDGTTRIRTLGIGNIIYLKFKGKCIYEKNDINDCFGKVDLKKN